MLNELSQVADSLERLGTVAPSRHPRINPMGKNRELLVVSLNGDGNPSRLEVLPGETAANLFRVEHGSAGSSFPGFNIPTPLRRLDEASADALKPAVEKLLALEKNKNSSAAEIKESIHALFTLSKAQAFSPSQEKQFQRSCSELVSELAELLPRELAGLKNFTTLVETLVKSKPTLPSFAESLAGLMVDQNAEFDRRQLLLFQEVLFGTLDWKKRTTRDCVARLLEREGEAGQERQPTRLSRLGIARHDFLQSCPFRDKRNDQCGSHSDAIKRRRT